MPRKSKPRSERAVDKQARKRRKSGREKAREKKAPAGNPSITGTRRESANRSDASASALELAADDIARGAAAVRRVRADAGDYSAEFESLVDFAQRRGFCEDGRLTAPPDARGHEHEVWFCDRENLVLKATYPNKFGLTLGARRDATPCQYLRRLALQNFVFKDDIQFLGVWNDGGRLRIVTSQPMIKGRTATDEEMEAILAGLEFMPLIVDENPLWYRPSDRVLAFDAHPRNFVVTQSGFVVPIDVNLVTASDDIATRLDAELPRAQHSSVD